MRNLKKILISSFIVVSTIVRANDPYGYHDFADKNGTSGWAYDPDAGSQPIAVHIYMDGPAGVGTLVGGATANINRPDLVPTIPTPDHGFYFSFVNLYLAPGNHSVYVYAINYLVGNNTLLNGSPYTFSVPVPNGDASITQNGITIQTTNRAAGAVEHLIWNGKEFIDIHDHGRQLQYAWQINEYGECYNPTEAGSAADGVGATSSSKLLSIDVTANSIETASNPAYWIGPGGSSSYCTNYLPGNAVNTTVTSDYVGKKKVTIGYQTISNVVEFKTTVLSPRQDSDYKLETPACYLHPDFNQLYGYDVVNKKLVPITVAGARTYQNMPLVFATQDLQYAIGLISPDLPITIPPGDINIGYGKIIFPSSVALSEMNVRVRIQNPAQVLNFTTYLPVGTLTDVKQAMDQLVVLLGANLQAGMRYPVGNIDNVSSSGLITGWLADPDSLNVTQTARVYLDGIPGGGQYMGSAICNKPSPGCPYGGNYGFEFQLPASAACNSHTLFIHPNITNVGIDTRNNSIGGSGMTINVNSLFTPAVSVVASQNPVCTSTNISFTASPVHGGTAPFYHWKVNGGNAGNNSVTFSPGTLSNSDQVSCVLTSNENCVSSVPVSSNTITIVVNPFPDNTVTLSSDTLLAIETGASYQWFDCNTQQPISGETSQAYVTTYSGSFGVILNKNGCIDTSNCQSVIITGLNVINSESIQVYPNPFAEMITVQTGLNDTLVSVQLYNLYGSLVKESINGNFVMYTIDLPLGIYFIQVKTSSETVMRKMVKN